MVAKTPGGMCSTEQGEIRLYGGIHMNNSKSQQHYRLTWEEVITHYQEGLITAPGLLYYYLKIRLAPGWKMTLHQREITEKLGISRAAFYKAISKLNQQGLIEFEAPNGITVMPSTNGDSRLRSETHSTNGDSRLQSETHSTNGDSRLQSETHSINGDSQSTIGDSSLQMETPSLRSETRTPKKPLPRQRYGDSPDSYQIFLNSLSKEAREKFLDFVREKVKNFNHPINDLEAWLAGKNRVGKERFAVYYEMFQAEVGEAVAPSQDWANHPQRDEWIAQIRQGKGRFVAQGGPREEWEMRQAFADWAVANRLVWEHLPR